MTRGYATLAAGGVRHPAHAVYEVRSSHGRRLLLADRPGTRVLSSNTAALVTYALQGVIQHGTGTAANLGRPAAGKTGTGQNYQDAWFCGYVPQLVTCVWVGYRQGEIPLYNVEGIPEVFGGSIPAEIWRDFMASALAGVPVRGFVTPSLQGYDTHPPHSVVMLPPRRIRPTHEPVPPAVQGNQPPAKKKHP